MNYENNEHKRYVKLAKAILSHALFDARKANYLETLNDIEWHFKIFAESRMCELCCQLVDIDVGRYRKMLGDSLEKGLEALKVRRVKYGFLNGVFHESTDNLTAKES